MLLILALGQRAGGVEPKRAGFAWEPGLGEDRGGQSDQTGNQEPRSEPRMTADELKQQLELPAVGQIGVVVEDLDRVASFLETSFGLGPFRVE